MNVPVDELESADPTRALLRLDARLDELRRGLREHPLYRAIRTPAHLRRFTEHHAVCVLDFMSLLKSLQRDYAPATVPWTPGPDPDAARFLQSIVLGEETDLRADGRVQSHFTWYLEGMAEIGADTAPIEGLVRDLVTTGSWRTALEGSRLPPAARTFGARTADFLEGPRHVRASVFFHGREEIIPEMFLPIVEHLEQGGLRASTLVEYFRRHIEVDGEEHGPLAEDLLGRACAGDGAKELEAKRAAVLALEARVALWDAIVDDVRAA